MPTLPAATEITGATLTEAQLKTAHVAVRDYIAALLGTAGTQAAALTALGALLNGFLSKSAAYTLAAADRGKIVICTGTWSLSLTGVGTLGAGFACAVANAGTGVITIDPSASQVIDGALTLNLAPGETCLLFCSGVAWYTVGRTKAPAGLAFADEYVSSTPGAWSTTAPAGATAAAVTVIGGQGGDGYSANADAGNTGGKGGGGGVSYEVFAVTPGVVLSGTVGVGGTGDPSAGSVNAGSGGASSCTQTGQTSNGGVGGVSISYGGAGGAGGSASGGTTNTTGATGVAFGASYPSANGATGSIRVQWRT